jgi:hypothetical protein
VEVDIGFNIEDLKNQILHESKSSSGPKKQYRHIYTASPQYTPYIDYYSFMVDDQFKSWSGFSYWDLVAIRYLFDNSTPYIILYQDINYFGQRFLVRGNISTLWANGEGFNDMASSVKVFNGARAILFQDSNYGGDPCYVEWDIRSLGDYSSFNDKTSSVLFY